MKKPNFEKPKEEAKKHEKESVSLVNELKINKEESQEDFLEEELEAKFWENLYKENLEEIKDTKEVKERTFNCLKGYIKKNKNETESSEYRACWAVELISSLKKLDLYKKEWQKFLSDNFENNDSFKSKVINGLDMSIQNAKKDIGNYEVSSLKYISSMKNLGLYKKEWQKKLKEIQNSSKLEKISLGVLNFYIEGLSPFIAIQHISSLKNLGIWQNQVRNKLGEIRDNEEFKKTMIAFLDFDINSIKDSKGGIHKILVTIASLESISEYWRRLADNKRANMARNKNKSKDIPKRPETRQ